ncbi:tetratricopeptide repeat protein [Fulvimonas sp. R45]|uniref:tetratricopeptide repeat protein n=1 Tax=Fulvimonas sp. R45 TaxID=3045937 RepID=UPI00265FD94D|nr:tetratricopeptide repeat protein [Fulvimonas sp. R45]MDO1529813.1 tetratricopeptide repeat protein [Fulvimonas sp. R45]
MNIDGLRAQCGGPRDGALLRFALGGALLDAGDAAAAVAELRQALAFDPAYSAAWKLLGKACLAAGDTAGAADAWRRGIEAARQRGDKQAEKEMTVFLRRVTTG